MFDWLWQLCVWLCVRGTATGVQEYCEEQRVVRWRLYEKEMAQV